MVSPKLLEHAIFKVQNYHLFYLSVRFKTNSVLTCENEGIINTINKTLPADKVTNSFIVSPQNITELHSSYKELNQSVLKRSDKNHFETPRLNDFGIQMVNEEICNNLFKDKKISQDDEKIKQCINNLKAHNLLHVGNTIPDIKLKLPELLGNSIQDHFLMLGEKFSKKYKNLVLKLIEGIPEIPEKWILQPGWTRYWNGTVEKVDFPSEDAIVLDVEVCCQAGALPTIATAVSNEAWYGWVSVDVGTDKNALNKHNSTDDLIPLESSKKTKGYNLPASVRKEKITVGHNVSFDRSKVKEQYWLEQSGMRFLDTMSLHVSVSGVTSYQKALLKAGVGDEEWSKVSSLNSLSKVHQLYCGTEISKECRELFLSGTLKDIQNNFQNAMHYCAGDVLATFNVLKIIFPIFLERFPHPVTLAGMLEIQSAYLPVNKNWTKYISEVSHVFEDLDMEAKCLMSQCANGVCELFHNENFKRDLWLWDQDWSYKSLKLKNHKGNALLSIHQEDSSCSVEKIDELDLVCQKETILNSKFSSLLSKKDLLPIRSPHFAGYPEWYRKLCDKPTFTDWVPEPTLVGTSLKITPKLMKLTWKSLPVHYEKGHGWGYIVPYKTLTNIDNEISYPLEQLTKYFRKVYKHFCSCIDSNEKTGIACKGKRKKKNSILCKAEIGSSCGFLKLPHKDGPYLNVGNPLAKDFINKFSENALSSDSFQAKRVIEINRMLSYWRNSRERVENQFVCWLKNNDLPPEMGTDGEIGAIIPLVVVCGTLTRRAVEPTWMTASNVSHERVGSELRGVVQAPPGFVLVGADVDSQELWIASLLGDAFAVGLHGATPLGWMTLNGKKSDGTDMHSVTAKAVGISRNNAKILNYARIYGAGEKFAQRLLKQFNEDITTGEAIEKAEKMMQLTKGKKVFKLKESVLPYIEERIYSLEDAKEFCKFHAKEIEDLFEKPQWMGGTESAMFNSLEMIACKPSPQTPFLNGKLSRALEPQLDQNDKHLPTRINWVVQSGAVDFLHLMLVSMRWFLGPLPRFCLSFHDEVRYLVPEKYKYEVALALHVTNLLTRAFCVSRVGMIDLPLSVAFFSSVEIDTVLRKDSKDDNKTPSNPFGLTKGYGIALGESLDIYQAIEKANGTIGMASS